MKTLCISYGNGNFCGGKFNSKEDSFETIKEAVDAWRAFPETEAEQQAWRDNPDNRFPCSKCLIAIYKKSGIKPRLLGSIDLETGEVSGELRGKIKVKDHGGTMSQEAVDRINRRINSVPKGPWKKPIITGEKRDHKITIEAEATNPEGLLAAILNAAHMMVCFRDFKGPLEFNETNESECWSVKSELDFPEEKETN